MNTWYESLLKLQSLCAYLYMFDDFLQREKCDGTVPCCHHHHSIRWSRHASLHYLSLSLSIYMVEYLLFLQSIDSQDIFPTTHNDHNNRILLFPPSFFFSWHATTFFFFSTSWNFFLDSSFNHSNYGSYIISLFSHIPVDMSSLFVS